MNLVYMGTPDFAVPSLEALLHAGHRILAVVSQPDRPRGRGRVLTPTPVKEVALRHGIPVLQPEKVREPDFVDLLRELAPEMIVVVAFGQILPTSILEIPSLGCVNVHASLLPRHRGAAPIQYSILEGDSETGVTTMLMDRGMDTGPILLQQTTPIFPEDTAGTLSARLSEMGGALLLETIAGLEAKTISSIPQDSSKATMSPCLSREDGQVDWNQSAQKVHNRIQGCNPRPGAFCPWRNGILKLWQSEVVDPQVCSGKPGEVLEIVEGGLIIQTGQGTLRLLQVQPEARSRMNGAEFARGYQIKHGDLLA